MKVFSYIYKSLTALSFLFIGSLLGAFLAFATQIILARELGPDRYGFFATGLATVTLIVPLATFGLQGFWLKVFGLEGWRAIRWLNPSLRFSVFTTTTTLLILITWAFFGPHGSSFSWLLVILLPIVIGYLFIDLVSGKLQLEERYNTLALWRLMPHFLRFLFLLVVIFTTTGEYTINSIGAAYAITAVIIIAIGSVQLLLMLKGNFYLKGHARQDEVTNLSEDLRHSKVKSSDIYKQSWPFALTGILYLIFFQSDVILLKYLVNDETAGIYSVAFSIMAAVYLLPSTIFQKFLLPKYHRWAENDRSHFLQVYRFSNGVILLLGILIASLIVITMPSIIPLLFGAAYKEAVDILFIIALCAPIHFLATSIGATLVTQEHMRRKVLYIGIGAIINISLNLLLIPLYGAKGAAVSTLVSEIILLVFFLFAVKRYVFGNDAWKGWNLKLKNTLRRMG